MNSNSRVVPDILIKKLRALLPSAIKLHGAAWCMLSSAGACATSAEVLGVRPGRPQIRIVLGQSA
jgi:hypothetical protein